MSERVDLEALEYAVTCVIELGPRLEADLLQAIAELRRLREFVGDYIDAYEGRQLSGEPCDALAQKAWELWEQVHPSAETLTLSEQNSGREG